MDLKSPSIIICTHNRASYLDRTLRSLERITYPRGRYEVLIVDNCSTDNTKDVAATFLCDSKFRRVRYLYESDVGLSLARNKGIKESTGDPIIFLDDDTEVDPLWLESIVDPFESLRADVVGGRVHLEYESPKPDWVTMDMELYLTRLEWGELPKQICLPAEWLAGANIAFKKEIFEKYSFSSQLGRKGHSLLSGEEIELCLKIHRDGGRIIYTPHAKIRHFVPPHRITKSFFRKRVYAGAFSNVIVERNVYGHLSVLSKIWTAVIQMARFLFGYGLAILRGEGIFEKELIFFSGLGTIAGILRLPFLKPMDVKGSDVSENSGSAL